MYYVINVYKYSFTHPIKYLKKYTYLQFTLFLNIITF